MLDKDRYGEFFTKSSSALQCSPWFTQVLRSAWTATMIFLWQVINARGYPKMVVFPNHPEQTNSINIIKIN